MTKLTRGQTLECGCVVGAYWCSRHDIYSVRTKPTEKWRERPNGSFVMVTLEPNKHIAEADAGRLASMQAPMDDLREAEGCSCHISPPCSWCTREHTECERCGVEIERDERVVELEFSSGTVLCSECEDNQ